MAIYIKGMEMPKDCQYCPCCKWKHNGDGILGCLAKNYYFTEMELCHEGKPSWCPLTEIPEPHGRLIDADKLADDLETDGKQFGDYIKLNCASWLRSESTPTVIDGSDEE